MTTSSIEDAFAYVREARNRQNAQMARAIQALAALREATLRVPQRTLDTLDRLAPLPQPAGLRA